MNDYFGQERRQHIIDRLVEGGNDLAESVELAEQVSRITNEALQGVFGAMETIEGGNRYAFWSFFWSNLYSISIDWMKTAKEAGELIRDSKNKAPN